MIIQGQGNVSVTEELTHHVRRSIYLLRSFSFKGKPVEVTVEIKVVSFGELNEANMVWYTVFVCVHISDPQCSTSALISREC